MRDRCGEVDLWLRVTFGSGFMINGSWTIQAAKPNAWLRVSWRDGQEMEGG